MKKKRRRWQRSVKKYECRFRNRRKHAKICNKYLRNERKREGEEKKKEISKQNICYALVIFSHEGRRRQSESREKTHRGRGKKKAVAEKERRGGEGKRREVNAAVFSCSAARRLSQKCRRKRNFITALAGHARCSWPLSLSLSLSPVSFSSLRAFALNAE